MKSQTYLAMMVCLTLLPGAPAAMAQGIKLANPPRQEHSPDASSEFSHQLNHEITLNGDQVEHHLSQVQHSTGTIARGGGASARVITSGSRYTPPPGFAQTLIIRTRELDPKAQAELEEDLNVMSRIVEKATEPESPRGPRAMGINLVFAPERSPVRSLYLEGYGVLFLVSVDFPLLPLAVQDKETARDKPDSANAWEQTREELFGNPRPPEPLLPAGWVAEDAEALSYDKDKVERLRTTLTEAIKNASNIRQIAADDSITICVQGASATPLLQVRRESSLNYSGGAGGTVDVQTILGEKSDARRAIMTLRARKADIDRFAGGEIDLEQFRELAHSQTYLGGNWNTPNSFIWNHR